MSSQQKESRQSALIKILQVTGTKSAKTLTYSTALLGMAALIPSLQLPSELAAIASGIGVNAIGSLLDRVANNEISNDDLLKEITRTIDNLDIENLLTKDDFFHAFAQLRKGQRSITNQNDEIAYILREVEKQVSGNELDDTRDKIIKFHTNWTNYESSHYDPSRIPVRFTITNFTNHQIKLAELSLIVHRRKKYPVIKLAHVGAPKEEFQLYADITSAKHVPLLDNLNVAFVLQKNETDAFNLLITGWQGTSYACQIGGKAFSIVDNSQYSIESPELILLYPIREAKYLK